jgi:hypothetical protein
MKLEREVSIPKELIDEDSPIGQTIEAARVVSTSASYAAQALADRARVLIRTACPDYCPNSASKANLMCASGRDGEPFRGALCTGSGCLVSQVQVGKDGLGFVFVGKRPTEDTLVKAIFRDPYEDDHSEHTEGQPAD